MMGHSLITVIYAEYGLEVPKGDEGVDGRALHLGFIVHENKINPLYYSRKMGQTCKMKEFFRRNSLFSKLPIVGYILIALRGDYSLLCPNLAP
jgi:hypothetical protein